MARLPQVGGDNGNWGQILNDFLTQSINDDGTLKTDSVGAAQLKAQSVTNAALADGTIQQAKLSAAVQAKLDAAISGVADGSITTAKIASAGLAPAAITGTAVTTTDSRLSDQRTPTDASVTSAKLSSPIQTSLTKADSALQAADIAGKLDTSTAASTYIPQTAKGANSGVASLDSAGLLPEAQVPSRLASSTLTAAIASQVTSGVASKANSTDVYLKTEANAAFALTDGVARIMKPTSNVASGVLDWEYQSTTGYLLHLRAGDNSGIGSSAFGIGTDHGSGSGGLFALKNDGNGLQIGSHASHTGKALTLSSYGKTAIPLEVALYSGSNPLIVTHKLGAGFPDGVTTSGSTTLTSATANFTAGDVGATLTQTTSRGEGFGAIPSGATVATFVNSTTITMSLPSTQTAVGVNMVIGTRVVPTSQRWMGFYNSANEQVISFAPAVSKFNSAVEMLGSTSTTADSQYINGGSQKFYSYNSTDYTVHEAKADAFSYKLRHYAAAAKGAEASPVTSISATISGGAPKIAFLGAAAVARPVVTGSRSDGTALASLLTALAALGLITNSSTT